jgi:hypothetical protein
MDPRTFDRRIGERRDVEGVEIGWYFGVPGRTPDDDPVTITKTSGWLVDVSASGAGVVAPHSRDVWIGCLVGFEFRGLQGTVRIRRIDRLPAEVDMRLYAIEFTLPNSELVQGLCDTFLAQHSGVPRWKDPRYREFQPAVDLAPAPVIPTPAASGDRPPALDAGRLGWAEVIDDPDGAVAPVQDRTS